MKIYLKYKVIYILLFVSSLHLNANNIQVSNISVIDQNVSGGFSFVKFDINWENSWRLASGPSNWDAAWVFIKYRSNSGPWLHAFLNNSGHLTGTGTSATISVGLENTNSAFNTTTNPGMGVFIHRSADGSGSFSQTGVQLRWNFAANGLNFSDLVDVQVFAIEMVYVPSGSYQLGDGTSSSIRGQFRQTTSNAPFQVSSENAITLGGSGSGNLSSNNGSGMAAVDDFNNSSSQTLPANFPKGFNAFYCMKYELSQQQWIDFFNSLDDAQKSNRDITGGVYNISGKASDAIVNRNNISQSSGDAFLNGDTFGNVACNFLSWMDGAAFADWAGLRPMSELEFEKSARGTNTAVSGEFAWGNTTINFISGISNSGASNEIASTSGNAVYNNNASVQGPIRVGALSTSVSNKEQAGVSFYGIRELSGNLCERTVSIGNSTGRNFDAYTHGNGILSSDGFCDISTWPGFSSGKITGATGSGLRGGAWDDDSTYLRTSDRFYSNYIFFQRRSSYGFRAVRTAN